MPKDLQKDNKAGFERLPACMVIIKILFLYNFDEHKMLNKKIYCQFE